MNYFKRLLFGILLVSANSLFGQTPQAFTYQAVATDVNGDELTEQSISIKALIVSGSQTWIFAFQFWKLMAIGFPAQVAPQVLT